ncbi:MAG: SDR family oxidoreductase, partial [Vallitaleaceae bacterium]|nr:SDR family oxidoreductase [Vallitaleaceae bacterium]
LNLTGVKLYSLDVTNEKSIEDSFQAAIKDFGKIDVLVNNAGYGGVGVFEAATKEQIQKQFDTNVFGLMNVTRAFLPHFRENKAGTLINISSVGGQITFPIYSLYHSTKWAVEGFSEALQFELRPFKIKVKLIEPGPIKTEFYGRSKELFRKPELKEYDHYMDVTYENVNKAGANAQGPELVAKMILKAANDRSYKMRYPVGGNAPFYLAMRRILPNGWFTGLVRSIVEKGL